MRFSSILFSSAIELCINRHLPHAHLINNYSINKILFPKIFWTILWCMLATSHPFEFLVFFFTFSHVRGSLYTPPQTQICTCTHTRTNAYMHAHKCTHQHKPHMHKPSTTCKHSHTNTYAHACTHARKRTIYHTRAHARCIMKRM